MAAAGKNLANRIEEMENSFLTIFFEAATKMAQSTESKLFFIMESSDGIRKIGGTSELKELFHVGRLLPRNSDVAIGEDAQIGESQSTSKDNSLNLLDQKPRKRRGKSDPVNPKKSRKFLEDIQWNDVQIKEEQRVNDDDDEEREEVEDEREADEDDGEDQPVGDYGIEGENDIAIPSQWAIQSFGVDHEKGDVRNAKWKYSSL